jgi:hypothetical protein
LPIDEYDEMNDFDDIKDAFSPIEDILHGTIPSIGIKLYWIGDKGVIVKDVLVFLDQEQFAI